MLTSVEIRASNHIYIYTCKCVCIHVGAHFKIKMLQFTTVTQKMLHVIRDYFLLLQILMFFVISEHHIAICLKSNESILCCIYIISINHG